MNFAFFIFLCSLALCSFDRFLVVDSFQQTLSENYESIITHFIYLLALYLFASAVRRIYGPETVTTLLYLFCLTHPSRYSSIITPVNTLILLSFALFLWVYNRLAMCILTLATFLNPQSLVLLFAYAMLIIVQRPSYTVHLLKPIVLTAALIWIFNHFWLKQKIEFNFGIKYEPVQFALELYSMLGFNILLFLPAWLFKYPPFKFSLPTMLYLLFSLVFGSQITCILPILLLLSANLLSNASLIRQSNILSNVKTFAWIAVFSIVLFHKYIQVKDLEIICHSTSTDDYLKCRLFPKVSNIIQPVVDEKQMTTSIEESLKSRIEDIQGRTSDTNVDDDKVASEILQNSINSSDKQESVNTQPSIVNIQAEPPNELKEGCAQKFQDILEDTVDGSKSSVDDLSVDKKADEQFLKESDENKVEKDATYPLTDHLTENLINITEEVKNKQQSPTEETSLDDKLEDEAVQVKNQPPEKAEPELKKVNQEVLPEIQEINSGPEVTVDNITAQLPKESQASTEPVSTNETLRVYHPIPTGNSATKIEELSAAEFPNAESIKEFEKIPASTLTQAPESQDQPPILKEEPFKEQQVGEAIENKNELPQESVSDQEQSQEYFTDSDLDNGDESSYITDL